MSDDASVEIRQRSDGVWEVTAGRAQRLRLRYAPRSCGNCLLPIAEGQAAVRILPTQSPMNGRQWLYWHDACFHGWPAAFTP